jgi:tryptophan halogenase
VNASFFVDASGPARRLMTALDARYSAGRTVCASVTLSQTGEPGPPCRIVNAGASGWQATTHLQGASLTLTVESPDTAAKPDLEIELGQLEQSWIGNCVSVGQAAWALEPLTPAPMMMLQRDIERLQELIPVDGDMSMERREYNRRFKDDVAHTRTFHNALYRSDRLPESAFWTNAASHAQSDALDRKIAQFENRGVLVSYDLDPFNEEDWTQNHLGMGRTPRQHDRQLDALTPEQAEKTLAPMRAAVEQMVSKMPPHAVYLSRFKAYLEKKRHA